MVLADELAGALDTKSAAPVFAILRGLARRGRTMMAMTQDLGPAAVQQRVHVPDGRVVRDGVQA